MSVRVQLIDALRVDSPDGVLHEADLRGRRAVVLFARLAVDPGLPVPAEALAEAIWGWEPPASWPAALRNTIAIVRSALDSIGLPGILRYARGAYRLELPPGSTVDLLEVEAATSGAELAASSETWTEARALTSRALTSTVGSFLPGPATPWVDELRTELVGLVARLRRVAGEAALQVGDVVEAEAIGRRLVEDTPLREDAHRFLMRALQAGGNTGEALRAYEACRRVLLEELGAAPSEATTDLFVSLLGAGDGPADDEPPRRSHVVAPLLLAHSGEGFVGRADLLARIARERAQVGEAGPRCLHLEGEPGIGKTRLAAEATAAAYDAGLAILYGRADARINVPYRPVLEAVGGYLATCSTDEQRRLLGAHAGVLARFLPSLRSAAEPTPPSGIAEVDQRRLADAVEHVLGLASAGRGAVLVLDDMHYVAESTLRLVQQVTSESTRLRVLVLLVHRPLAEGGTRALMDELVVRPNAAALAVGPLDEGAVGELVRRHLGPDLPVSPDPLAHELWLRTDGNPLLIGELLRAVDPTGPLELPARSTGVEELVRERVSGLAGPALAVLTVAAVAGLEFDPDVVHTASGTAPDEARAVLAAARREGLVVPAPTEPGWLAFRHSVVQESLVAPLTESARRAIHQRLGSVLEERLGPSPVPPVALAYHFDEAAPLGEWRRAVRYLLRVARTADEEWMHDEVADAARRALTVLEDAGDPDPGARIDALTLLGRAQTVLEERPASAVTLDRAFREAVELGDPVRAARAALAYEPSPDSDTHGVPPHVVERCHRAVELLGDRDPVLRARLLGRLACAVAWSADGEAGRRHAEEALALARRVDDPVTLATVLRSRRRTLSGSGQVREQRALEVELLPLARQLDDVAAEQSALAAMFETAVEAGEGDRLERLLEELDGACARSRTRGGGRTYMAAYSHAALALLRGRLDEAEQLVDEAAVVGRRRGVSAVVTDNLRLIQLAGLRREQGRLAEVHEELRTGLERTEVPEWMGAVAVADAALGDLESARKHLDLVFHGFAVGGARPTVGIGFVAHLAEAVLAVGDLERARGLYDLLAPHAGVGAFFAYFAGPIDWHLGLLAAGLGQDLAAQAHLRAAEEFSRRLGAAAWVARCAAARRA